MDAKARILRDAARYLGIRGEPSGGALAVLEAYQRHLRSYRKADGNTLAVGGQLSRLSAVKNFFRWLLKRHVILYSPAEMLTLPKEEKRLPAQVFSERTRAV